MQRDLFNQLIIKGFKVNPAVALLGPRQCGKTTLANMYIAEHSNDMPVHYFDLEKPSDLARLQNPELVLQQLEGLIVIDEIQRLPELFPLLRVLIDNQTLNQYYLILGSASRELVQQSSETLAGRIQYLELTPFQFNETQQLEKLWLRGGFPRAYLAKTNDISYDWRQNYIRTYLEQDIPNLGITIPAANLRRFWNMLAHYHGNILNTSELGRSLNLSHNTIRNYIDILIHTFMIRQLSPWFENLKKRQVKSPKIYFRDSGIYHTLHNIHNKKDLWINPKLGASWEGFALEEVIRKHRADPEDCFFWATHAHAELDLLITKDGIKRGFEFKFTEQPKLTKSMKIAMADLNLDELTVIYPGEHTFPLAENVRACGLEDYLTLLA